MSLGTEIGRLERRIGELDPIGSYGGLNNEALRAKAGQLHVLQIEARAFLLRLRDGGRIRKAITAASDAATCGGFLVFGGAGLSIPIFIAIDAAASGVFTLASFAASIALRARTLLLRRRVASMARLQDEITRHIGALEAATARHGLERGSPG